MALILDPTAFTTKEMLLELAMAKQFGQLAAPKRGEVRKFTAVALTDAVPLSGEAFAGFIGDERSGIHIGAASMRNLNQSRFIVKAMIVANEDGDLLSPSANPHGKLPNPCNYTETEDSNLALRIIMLYTSFISSRHLSMADDITIRRNDRILVSLNVNQNGEMEIEHGELLHLAARSEDEFVGLSSCAHLSGLFDISGYAAMSSGTPPQNPVYTPGDPANFKSSYDVLPGIPREMKEIMEKTTLKPDAGCPVGFDDLVLLSVTHKNKKGEDQTGQVIVRNTWREAVTKIFKELYILGYQIERMEPIHVYEGDDLRSMAANNTSIFNCRSTTGISVAKSSHSRGEAIDLNPLVNPYVQGKEILPIEGSIYKDRSIQTSGTVTSDVVKILEKHGFQWGGNWRTLKDYQHFSTDGR